MFEWRGIAPALDSVAASARSYPDALAVLDGDGSARTYAELWGRAEALAARLDVADGELVGLCLPRSVAMVEAVLGVLMAGGVYCPFGPDDPPERTAALRSRIGARVMLRPDGSRGVTLDDDGGPGRQIGAGVAGGERPMYVMWTSGSTGEPKAVVIPHRGVQRLVDDREFLTLDPGDRVAFAASPMFDAVMWEVWASLGNGAALVTFETDDVVESDRFRARVDSARVTHAFLSTSVFSHHAQRDPAMFGNLRGLAVGGEALRVREIRAVLDSPTPPQRLVNGYGPTECTVFAVSHHITAVGPSDLRVPIGTALPGTTAIVVDDVGDLAQSGTPGELWIAGAGVGLGYLDAGPEHGARFVATTFPGVRGDRWYRTGDLAVERADGTLDMLGRIDRQVKINGLRIEPAEVERVLGGVAGVAGAVVVPSTTGRVTTLVGCVVADVTDLDPDRVLAQVRTVLPKYMVPSHLVAVDRFPVTANGKLDADAVRDLVARSAGAESALARSGAEGQDPFVRLVAERIGAFLGREPVAPEFDLQRAGLDSLATVALVEYLLDGFEAWIDPATLMEQRTPAALAEILRSGTVAHRSDVLTFNAMGRSAPLVLVPGAGELGLRYHALAEALGSDQPVVVVGWRGILSGQPPDRTVPAMAAWVVAQVAERQRDGPVNLGGWSGGGIVALHAASLLEAAGRDVRLVLLDVCFDDLPFGLGVRRRLRWVAWIVRTRMRLARKQAWGAVRARKRGPGRSRDLERIEFVDWLVSAIRRYRRVARFEAPVLSVQAEASAFRTPVEAVVPGAEVVGVAGDHFTLLDAPNAPALAHLLTEWLATAAREHGAADASV